MRPIRIPSPRLLISLHLTVTGFLAALNLSPLMSSWSVRRLFDLNGEGNLVVWFSSTSLLALALLAWSMARVAAPRDVIGWRAIGVLFAFLSLDETARLHELVGVLFSENVAEIATSPGVFAWVPLLAPAALVVAVALARWLVRVAPPSHGRRLGLGALAVWVLVPVVEFLDPVLGAPTPLLVLEESLELIGIALMLGAFVAIRGGAAHGLTSMPNARTPRLLTSAAAG